MDPRRCAVKLMRTRGELAQHAWRIGRTGTASFAHGQRFVYDAGMPAGRRHLTMLRSYTWADAFTIGNAACGTIAVFCCLEYMAEQDVRVLWWAFLLLPLALVLDVLDGHVARLDRSRQSRLGADLDSLADVISFGVAPAVLGYTLGLRGGWDMLILTYFVVCGVSRLARFNVTAADPRGRDHGQGEVLRGHADSDQHRHRGAARRRRVVRSHRPRPVARRLAPRSRVAAPPRARLRRQRQRHDQRDLAGAEAVAGNDGGHIFLCNIFQALTRVALSVPLLEGSRRRAFAPAVGACIPADLYTHARCPQTPVVVSPMPGRVRSPSDQLSAAGLAPPGICSPRSEPASMRNLYTHARCPQTPVVVSPMVVTRRQREHLPPSHTGTCPVRHGGTRAVGCRWTRAWVSPST